MLVFNKTFHVAHVIIPTHFKKNAMKYCPICKRTYSDDKQNFCLDDGELLVGDSVEFRQATTQKIPNISPEPAGTTPDAPGISHQQPNYAYEIVIGDGTVASAIDRFRKHLQTTTGIYKTMMEISG